MRASFCQMSASALDFQYRLLRRAIAYGGTIGTYPYSTSFHPAMQAFSFISLFSIFFFIFFMYLELGRRTFTGT